MSIRNPFPGTTIARTEKRVRGKGLPPPKKLDGRVLSERAKAAMPAQGMTLARLPNARARKAIAAKAKVEADAKAKAEADAKAKAEADAKAKAEADAKAKAEADAKLGA